MCDIDFLVPDRAKFKSNVIFNLYRTLEGNNGKIS